MDEICRLIQTFDDWILRCPTKLPDNVEHLVFDATGFSPLGIFAAKLEGGIYQIDGPNSKSDHLSCPSALQINVKSVLVLSSFIAKFWVCLPPENAHIPVKLMTAVLNIPGVEELEISNDDRCKSTSPIDFDPCWFIQRNLMLSLKSLRIDVTVYLSRACPLLKVLQEAAVLENLALDAINLLGEVGEKIAVATAFVNILLHLPNLYSLYLRVRNFVASPLIADSILVNVTGRRKIRRLGLVNMGLNDDSVMLLLEELKSNSSLESLDLRGNWMITEASFRAIFNLMKDQMYVKQWTLQSEFVDWCQDAEVRYAQNSALTIGRINHPNNIAILEAKIASFGRLNQLGRRHLVAGGGNNNNYPIEHQRIMLMAAVCHDLDALYNLFLRWPEFCQSALQEHDSDLRQLKHHKPKVDDVCAS